MVPGVSGTTIGTYTYAITSVTAGTVYFDYETAYGYTTPIRKRVNVVIPKAFRWFDQFRKKLNANIVVDKISSVKAPIKVVTSCSIIQKKHQKRKHFLFKIRKS
mgnify:CR=1 FL=1